MKKSKVSVIFSLVIVLVLVVVLTACGKGGVDKEYEYNTEIISNANAPVEGEPNIKEITGFVEDSEQEFLELPYDIGDTGMQIVSIGKYSGAYTDANANKEVKDVLAVVVKNPTEKVISYSNFTMQYCDEFKCTFTPTNVPKGQSVLVFAVKNAEEAQSVSYADVEKLECVDSMAVTSDSLPLLEGTVGVDFKDGEFIVTNLTRRDLGDVYIRYKNAGSGNAYLGGVTYSCVAFDLKGFETQKVPAENFNAETSVIIAVENHIDENK